jgi:aerobic carbon-monoxide dehydrogenase small subunit
MNGLRGYMVEECQVHFRVNGQPVSVCAPPLTSLVEILRDHLNLRGTKVGCSNGECGACTVLLDGEPVNACLVVAPQLEGTDVLTIEGLTTGDGQLNPVQQAFLDHGAVQCGFCSPGMILSAVALLAKNHKPSREEIKEAISGNLCRCTGYQKIVEAIEGVLVGP